MVETVEYQGIRFRRYPDAKRRSDRLYFKATGHGYLHRAIWRDAHGPIPEGAHIHHVDGDPSNNQIGNLACVTPKQHIAEHWTPDRADFQRAHVDRIRPLTVEWHRSPEGRAWHAAHAREVMANRQRKPSVCDQCGKPFGAWTRANRFCSNNCKSAWRRDAGLDDVDRECVVCGESFRINKYARKKTCSHDCARLSSSRTKRGLQPDGRRDA